MFKLFKNKKDEFSLHQCNFQHCLGFYYKLYRTKYINGFDCVRVYARVQCECGRYKDVEMANEKFLPSMYNSSNVEREKYIKELEKNEIQDECSFNVKTNLYSNRVI